MGLFSGLLSGLLVGYVVEHYRLRNGLRIERMKRLTPHIEMVHPIIEELCDDASYFQKSHLRTDGSEEQNLAIKIGVTFDKYGTWYQHFQSNGLKPELAATSKSLFALLSGLFVHSTMTKKYGKDYIYREIDEIANSMQKCLLEVEQFLAS
jgi:hypothetical protein